MDEEVSTGESDIAKSCDEEWRKYQKNFPSVPYMTSKELLEMEDESSPSSEERIMLVDVRTADETNVSMLPNAMTLEEWKANELPKLTNQTETGGSSKKQLQKVVFYCTIGYRSGEEAKKFQEAYPDLNWQVYSLDGIVPYTHAAKAGNFLPLIRRQKGGKAPEATKRVHAFGDPWKKFANPDFDVVVYSKPKLFAQGMSIFFKKFFG